MDDYLLADYSTHMDCHKRTRDGRKGNHQVVGCQLVLVAGASNDLAGIEAVVGWVRMDSGLIGHSFELR